MRLRKLILTAIKFGLPWKGLRPVLDNSIGDMLIAAETRASTLLAAGFREVQLILGVDGMCTHGQYGCQTYPAHDR